MTMLMALVTGHTTTGRVVDHVAGPTVGCRVPHIIAQLTNEDTVIHADPNILSANVRSVTWTVTNLTNSDVVAGAIHKSLTKL